MSEMLTLKNVTKKFGGLTAVGGVDFSIKKGEIFGLIGPNGAGKTTIFNLITGIYGLTEGDVLFEGKSISGLKPFQIANTGITRTFQNIRLFKNLTTYENVLIACHKSASYGLLDSVFRTRKFKNEEKLLAKKAEDLMELMRLTQHKNMLASNLPYGLQRRLEIARALALNPKLILLDEPAAGMNPEETLRLMELIREIRDKLDVTVLVIEHHMDLIMGVCDRIFVLNFGLPLAQGSPKEIQDDKNVIEAYLGKEDE